jgi:hypothetical protein
MHKKYINLENLNHKLVIIFLENGRMVSPILMSGKMVLNTWWLHHSGSISCDHMVSARVSQMEHKDMLHATYRLKIAICYRNKRHFPLRDRCSRVRHANEKTK